MYAAEKQSIPGGGEPDGAIRQTGRPDFAGNKKSGLLNADVCGTKRRGGSPDWKRTVERSEKGKNEASGQK